MSLLTEKVVHGNESAGWLGSPLDQLLADAQVSLRTLLAHGLGGLEWLAMHEARHHVVTIEVTSNGPAYHVAPVTRAELLQIAEKRGWTPTRDHYEVGFENVVEWWPGQQFGEVLYWVEEAAASPLGVPLCFPDLVEQAAQDEQREREAYAEEQARKKVEKQAATRVRIIDALIGNAAHEGRVISPREAAAILDGLEETVEEEAPSLSPETRLRLIDIGTQLKYDTQEAT